MSGYPRERVSSLDSPGTYKVCMKQCPDNFFTLLDMATDQETQQIIMERNSKNDQLIPNLIQEKLFFGFFKNFQLVIDPALHIPRLDQWKLDVLDRTGQLPKNRNHRIKNFQRTIRPVTNMDGQTVLKIRTVLVRFLAPFFCLVVRDDDF